MHVNLKVRFEVIPKPRYNSNEVVLEVIERLKVLLSNDRMQINGPLNIAAIISDLDRLKSVESIPLLEFENIHGGSYSNNTYDVAKSIKNNILYPSLDPCIFEIKYPNRDIEGRAVKP